MGITNTQDKYCLEVAENLKNQGLRVETDLRYEKVGFKIREHTIKRVPFLLVAGEREVEGRTLSIRTRAGEDLGTMELPKLYAFLREEVASRGTVV
jgi:threonyl-tRNA synthetase